MKVSATLWFCLKLIFLLIGQMWESHSNGRKLLQRRPPHHQLVSCSSNKPDPPPMYYVPLSCVCFWKERRTWKQRLHDSTSLITAVSYIGIISQLFITTQPTCTVQLIEPQWLLMEGGVTMWIHHCNSPRPPSRAIPMLPSLPPSLTLLDRWAKQVLRQLWTSEKCHQKIFSSHIFAFHWLDALNPFMMSK